MKVTEGKRYSKVAVSSKITNFTITINHEELNTISLDAAFKPTGPTQYDYFLKIDSPLSTNGVFYHDSNGFLVSKRKVGERPDYEWNYKNEDKINANTYPMCSFGYFVDGNKKVKLILFS